LRFAAFRDVGPTELEQIMSNRIDQYLSAQTSVAAKLCERPTLALSADRPITVDMERFFDFSFSFAEALLDLEDKYLPQKSASSMQRELAIQNSLLEKEFDFDVDVRWM
jgi:hypothetical protein